MPGARKALTGRVRCSAGCTELDLGREPGGAKMPEVGRGQRASLPSRLHATCESGEGSSLASRDTEAAAHCLMHWVGESTGGVVPCSRGEGWVSMWTPLTIPPAGTTPTPQGLPKVVAHLRCGVSVQVQDGSR